MNFKLDFSKFKKIGSDKGSTMMQHPEGHTIQIAHDKLSPKMREQLARIPMHKPDEAAQTAPDPIDQPMKMSKGGRASKVNAQDPTQKHLMPGDKVPNAIERQVVDQAARKMAQGGDITEGYVAGTNSQEPNIVQGYYANSQPPQQSKPSSPKPLDTSKITPVSESEGSAMPFSDVAPVAYKGGIVRQSNPKLEESKKLPPSPGKTSAKDQAGSMVSRLMHPAISQGGYMADGGEAKPPMQVEQISQDEADDSIPTIDLKNNNQASNVPAPTSDDGQPQGTVAQTLNTNPDQQAPPASANQDNSLTSPPNPNQTPTEQIASAVGNEAQLTGQGLSETLQSIPKEAALQGQLQAQQAQSLEHQAHTQQAALDTLTKEQHNTQSLYDTTVQDIHNGHIDPNQLLDKPNDTGPKIGRAIGLLLGGFGSGVTGQPNAAMDFINKQIDRDIDAQKFNMNKNVNLVGVLSKHLGDIDDASLVAKQILSGVTADTLAAQAAKMQPGILQQKAIQAAAQMKMQYAPQISQMNLKRAAYASGASGDADKMVALMRIVNPDMAKEMETRLVPNMGPGGESQLARVAVPADVRAQLVAKTQLGNMAKDFYSWAQQNSGSLSPSQINVGKTKAAEFQSLYRNSINGGVFKKGEQEFIDNIIDSEPTKFFNNIRVLPKLGEVIKSNEAQLNTLKKGYGLPPTGNPQQTSQPIQNISPEQQRLIGLARANPNNPKAQMFLKKMGIQ